jgi:hypothetical protein
LTDRLLEGCTGALRPVHDVNVLVTVSPTAETAGGRHSSSGLQLLKANMPYNFPRGFSSYAHNYTPNHFVPCNEAKQANIVKQDML